MIMHTIKKVLPAFLIIILLISLVSAATLIKSRQIAQDWSQNNITNVQYLQVDNGSFGLLNTTSLIIDNVQIEALGNPFKLENYSDEYGKTGYNGSNFSLDVAAYDQLYKGSNYSDEYAATGYKTANVTLGYPNLDYSITDDFNLKNNLSFVQVPVTFEAVVTFSQDVIFFGNISVANSSSINGSFLPSLNGTLDLGNGSLYWRNVYVSDDVLVQGNPVQTREAIYTRDNFTTNIGEVNSTLGVWDVEATAIKPADSTINVNITNNLHVNKNVTFDGAINHTLPNQSVRYFFNGCEELANASGIHIIC